MSKQMNVRRLMDAEPGLTRGAGWLMGMITTTTRPTRSGMRVNSTRRTSTPTGSPVVVFR